MSKAYVVTLDIRIGETEKISRHLVQNAATEEEAIEHAICMESHDREPGTPPEGRWYEDLGGEYAYRVNSIKEAEPAHIPILAQYF